jgi:aminoglycoside phosphotransferase (APT) family kinase protein
VAELGGDWNQLKSESLDGLVDLTALGPWLDERGLAPGRPLEATRISGGMSNESIGLTRGGERWVLRRPARVALDGADRGMRREFRLLSAIQDTGLPVPRVHALCTDPQVIGAVFYVMDFVDGFTGIGEPPRPFAEEAGVRREASLSCMHALGHLHSVDWRACGLEDFGRPSGFHERQVGRWLKQLDATQGREHPGLRDVGAWLDANRPSDGTWTPTIMHGDYHSGNVMLALDAPGRVAAILDWENATIGDPLLDLGGFLRLWGTSERASWCDEARMIDAWCERSGLEVSDLRYYKALSAFKLSVMLEGIYQRSNTDASRGSGHAMGDMAAKLAAEARTIVDA